jgi:hypothetical protein
MLKKLFSSYCCQNIRLTTFYCHYLSLKCQIGVSLEYLTLTYIDERLFQIELWKNYDEKDDKRPNNDVKDRTCVVSNTPKHIAIYRET